MRERGEGGGERVRERGEGGGERVREKSRGRRRECESTCKLVISVA